MNKKVVVVSGGSKGLGLNLVKTLLSDGYYVATFSRKNTPELLQLMERYNHQLYWRSLDISNIEDLARFTKDTRVELGRIGYLVNCAGIATEGLLTLMKARDVSQMVGINLEGAVSLTQECAKQMIVGCFGVIVNISSIVGLKGFKGVAAYSATKAALDGFTRSLSTELGVKGIRVNSVAPGFMETDMTNELTEKQKSRIIRQTPLGRLGTVDDVSSVVRFLFSNDARFITGQTIVVDGGLTV